MSDTIFVKGVWKILRPDIRQYKQQSIEIELTAEVGVRVPNTEEFVFPDTNVLTPAGMAYVQKQFEASYPMDAPNDGWSNNKPKTEQGWDDDPGPTTDQVKAQAGDEWDDVKDVTDVIKPASVKAEWGDEPTFEEAQTTVPDTEVWNPEEEGWES